MLKLKCRFLFCFVVALLCSNLGYAQLSANPWAVENDDEAIEEVYNKRQRRGYSAPTEYQREENVVIDRTHAYIQDEDIDEDKSFVDKMKDAFSGKKEEKPLIANTSDNRKAVAKKKAIERAQREQEEKNESSGGMFSSFGMKGIGGFKMPSLDTAGMIKKFEKASGVNLKSIGRKFK